MSDHTVVVKLRQAVLELASTSSEGLTISAICAAAGVSRTDFHSAAANPIQLLGEALSDELLSQLAQAHDDMPQGDRLRISLNHVSRWSAFYQGPLHHELIASLQKTLFAALRSTNVAFMASHPEILPAGVRADDEFAITFIASHMAGASIAAFAHWIEEGDDDIERAIELFRALAPRHMAPLWNRTD